jgi:hypothetical protein
MKIVSDPFKPLGEFEKAFAKAKARLLFEENLQRPRLFGAARAQLSSIPLHAPEGFLAKTHGRPSAFNDEFVRRVFRSALSGVTD